MFKKTVAFLLVFMLCFSASCVLCGCGQTPDGNDETSSESPEGGSEKGSEKASDAVTGEEVETSDTGHLAWETSVSVKNPDVFLKDFNPSELKYDHSCGGITFYENTEDSRQLYAYVESWDAYYQLPRFLDHIYDYGIGDVFLNETTAEIVMYQMGEYTEDSGNVITTVKLTRGNEKTESYTNNLATGFGNEDRFIFHYYQEDCAYLFFLPIESRDPITGKWEPYRLKRYATTDGGKTWRNEENEVHLCSACIHEHPVLMNFLDQKVGIISFDYHVNENPEDRTYFTTDSGKTWELFSALLEGDYSGIAIVRKAEKLDDRYLLIIVVISLDRVETRQYESTDFLSWTLTDIQIISNDDGK